MAEVTWKDIAELFILPPACLFILFAAGCLVAWRRPRLGAGIAVASVLGLYLLSTEYAASRLIRGLEAPPLAPAAGIVDDGKTALVVLGGNLLRATPEYGGDTVGSFTLERLRYAARLHRATGVPILVTGGFVKGSSAPIARLMRDSLVEDFRVKVRWLEERSRTTEENAAFSAEMLRRDGIARVLLVTHAWHMPRAVRSFEASGLEVVPAPTVYAGPVASGADAWLPRATSLRQSFYALHEWIGLIWYRLKLARALSGG